MDPDRVDDALTKLEVLDDRLAHRVRSIGSRGRHRPGVEQLGDRLRTLAEYTLELKQVVRELLEATAAPGGDDEESEQATTDT